MEWKGKLRRFITKTFRLQDKPVLNQSVCDWNYIYSKVDQTVLDII